MPTADNSLALRPGAQSPAAASESLVAGSKLGVGWRSGWRSGWLLAQGEPSERVAAVTGYSLTWVRTVARRYNARGEAGLGDRRHAHRGGPRLLTAEQEAALDPAREGAAPGGGRWTAAQVADWIEKQLGRTVAEETGWRYRRRRDWRPYRPRPQHATAAGAAQAAFGQTDSAST